MTSAQLLLVVVAAVGVPFVVSLVAGFFVRRHAHGWGLVDRPDERKRHEKPTPLGGGLAIWLGVIGAFSAGQIGLLIAGDRLPEFVQMHAAGLESRASQLWGVLIAGTVLMVLGLWDDRRGISWQVRLGVQCAVAGMVVWQGIELTAFLSARSMTGVLSVIWIVAMINSFNMLDNMDGLSGGVAAIAGTTLAILMLVAPDPVTRQPQLFVGGFLLVIVGSLLGFLWHNRPPARMFMGDAGSYFIGFCIAVATLLATYTSYSGPTPHRVLAPVLVMAVPLYDMCSVLFIRLREGRSLFEADRRHFSHRLVELGLSRTQAVGTIYLTTTTCGLGALLLHRVDVVGGGLIVGLVLSVLGLVAILESATKRCE